MQKTTMKHTFRWKFWLLLWCIGCMLSCNSDGMALFDALADIEEQGDTAAAEALQRLEQMERSVEELHDEHLANRYKLLGIRLRDKAYITHTSSDEAMGVVEYFEKNGSQEEKLEAYYYLASVCRDLKDYPQAMDYFLRVECSDTTGLGRKSLRLIKNACSQLTSIYRLTMLPQEAFEMAKQGLALSEMLGEQDIVMLMDVAQTARDVQESALGRTCMDKAFGMLQKENGWRRHPDITAELMRYYAADGDTEKAEVCKASLERMVPQQRPHNYLKALVSYYNHHQQTDSMLTVQKQIAETSGSWAGRANASRWLSEYFLEHGDMERAGRYSRVLLLSLDSVNAERKQTLTALSGEQQRYSHIKDRYQEAQLQAERMRTQSYMILFALSGGLLVVIAFSYWRERCHSRKLALKNEQLTLAVERIQKAYDEIREKDNVIQHKDEMLAKDQLRMRALLRHSILTGKDAELGEVSAWFEAASSGDGSLTAEDWDRLMAAVDKVCPDFAAAMQGNLRLMGNELIRTAYLLKIGLSNTQISTLTGAARQTAWNRTRKLHSMLGKDLFVQDAE